MLKAIIIEDEMHAANLLEALLYDIKPEVQLVDKCVDLPSGVKSIKINHPDLVFLDIELPVYSGLQLLDFFNTEELIFKIIFTTAFNQYAINAFEMCAVDYLMKPLQFNKLTEAVRKAQKQQGNSSDLLPILKHNSVNYNNKKIVIPVNNGFEVLVANDICYIQAEGSYASIHFISGSKLLVSKNLKHFETLFLHESNFLRIHRSYIANLNHAKKLIRKDGCAVLLNHNFELPVSDERVILLMDIILKL